jgi:hypothetical protein
LQRWLDETAGVTIEEAAMVAACLAALGGREHGTVLTALRNLTAPLARRRGERTQLDNGAAPRQ